MKTIDLKQLVRRAALLAGCVAMMAIAASASGGQITVTFSQSVTNACNNLSVGGSGKATIIVTAGSDGQGALVSVSYAPAVFTDTNGGTYIETGAAVAAFTAQSTHYTVPLQLNYKGQNGAQRFSVLTDEEVLVNPNQAPTFLNAPGISGKCGF